MRPPLRRLLVAMKGLASGGSAQGVFPAGHYYSPVPDRKDVLAYFDSRPQPELVLPGIDLNERSQHRLLEDLSAFYPELPFSERPAGGCRYYYDNQWFGYSDAIFLYGFLRRFLPKKIIEVGSGFSSAVMLDTIDRFFSFSPDVTFVEPYPERLLGLLGESGKGNVALIESGVQSVPIEAFLALQAGDLLFIDSSHVVKCGSDLQFFPV